MAIENLNFVQGADNQEKFRNLNECVRNHTLEATVNGVATRIVPAEKIAVQGGGHTKAVKGMGAYLKVSKFESRTGLWLGCDILVRNSPPAPPGFQIDLSSY